MATLITLARFPLLGLVVLTLYWGPLPVRLAGVALLGMGLLLDTVDGVVARRRQETSLLGGVLDIAADRTYELILWFCFADLGLIPIWIPLAVTARTTLTDAFRSLGVRHGVPPLEQPRSPLARYLVTSSWMRSGYGLCKAVAFGGLALVQATGGAVASPRSSLLAAAQALALVTTVFCLVRGAPVIADGFRPLRPLARHRPDDPKGGPLGRPMTQP